VLHGAIEHRFEQVQGIGNIVPEILARVHNRFTDVRVRDEVNDGLDLILNESSAERIAISKVTHHERPPTNGEAMSLAQVVEGDGLMVRLSEVAMESIGVYWKPVSNVLEGTLEVLVVNAQHIKQVPGRKTDVRDCE